MSTNNIVNKDNSKGKDDKIKSGKSDKADGYNALLEVYSKLHPIEKEALPHLGKVHTIAELASASGMEEVKCTRAVQWLASKGIIAYEEKVAQMADLTEIGRRYAKDGLPERRLLNQLNQLNQLNKSSKDSSGAGGASLKKTADEAGIDSQEATAALGILKSKAAIEISKLSPSAYDSADSAHKANNRPEGLYIRLTSHGEQLKNKKMLEEIFLANQFPKDVQQLTPEEKNAFESLKSRKKIITTYISKEKKTRLTQLGEGIVANLRKLESESFAEKLTPEMLKDGSWARARFRKYDVNASVPKIGFGRKQHYRKFLDDVRIKFLALGFREMDGPVAESEFWDMDALFMPQFHSARDIHQGYYIKKPKYAEDIPENVIKNVKEAHENGFGTGSTGWGYEFDAQRTKRLILRTHDTSISARTLASRELKIPGKYFQISRCFRYDVIDMTHLPDFNQVGGFVIDENINFGHLKALLKMFAEEFAETEQIRIKPGYFPFTEPSAELQAKHPDFGWIELAGSGMFRPELVKPLVGREVPVIAWGVGLDRLAMFKLGINDIRDLFSHDIEFLRNVKMM